MKCCECGKALKSYRLRAIALKQDGSIDYACRPCWDRFDYASALKDVWR
jgi:hypothetical protein